MRISRRRTVPATVFLTIYGLLSSLGASPAQDAAKAPQAKAGDAVFAFFSSSATVNPTGDPTQQPTYLSSLSPRLNTENQIFAYVYNPSARAQVVDVVLQAGDDAARVELSRTAESVTVPSKETKRIAFAPLKSPAPPVPAAPVAPEKAKADEKEGVKPRGVALPANANLYLRVVLKGAKLDEKGKEDNSVNNINRNFRSESFSYTVASVNNSATVAVTYKSNVRRLTNAPVKLRLDARADLNPQLKPASLLKGTFEAELPPQDDMENSTDDKYKAVTATLVVEGVEFESGVKSKATLGVTIDGYDRAFLFETDFNGSNAKLEGTDKLVPHARLSSYAQVPGKPVTIAVEADGAKPDQPVELLVDRVGKGEFDVLRKFPTDRSREVFLFVGEDGAVGLTPVVKDWTVEFPTAQVAGKRAFAVRIAVRMADADRDAEIKKLPKQVLVVDRTPPVGVAIVTKPTKDQLLVGKVLNLSAVGTDPDSGIDRVYFFTGETPPALDGKPAPGSRVIPGQLGKALLASTYTTVEPFRLPEVKGEVRVGVIAFNKVGLSTVSDLTLYVRTPPVPPEKPTTGSIVGRAVQAGRPQPGLPVSLTNAAGKVVKETKSDDLGKFEFKDLPPGSYTVAAVKKADANAGGKVTVEVKADKDPTQIKELVIKR